VYRFGGDVVMTRWDHTCGTDRVVEEVPTSKANIIVNVRGHALYFSRSLIPYPRHRTIDFDVFEHMGLLRLHEGVPDGRVVVVTGSGSNIHEGVTTQVAELIHKGLVDGVITSSAVIAHEMAGALDRVKKARLRATSQVSPPPFCPEAAFF
jgi:hypothetical protein